MGLTFIPYQSAYQVLLKHPIDDSEPGPPNPLNTTDDGFTASFKVYDPTEEAVLTVAAVATATLTVGTSAGLFLVGDIVELNLDDGTVDESTVLSVDPVAGTVTIAAVISSPAAAGSRFRVRLGPEIAMTEYGTPSLVDLDWGFQGVLPPDHPGLTLGRFVNIEITGVGAVPGALDTLEVLCGKVVDKVCV